MSDQRRTIAKDQRTVAAQWATYRERVLPPDAGPVQVRETQWAFYAGAECFLVLLMNVLDPGTDATEEDLALMDRLHEELLAFARSVEGQARR